MDWSSDASLDVTCPGRFGDEECSRLVRFELERGDASGVTYNGSTISKAAHYVPDEDWTRMTFTCRCGRTSVVPLDVVRSTLAGMLERDVKLARVSAARLSTLGPPAL